MAGDKGVEPLQTRSQSPARYHYANPQYKQGTKSVALSVALPTKLYPGNG